MGVRGLAASGASDRRRRTARRRGSWAVVGWVALLTLGCEGDSPTSPSGPGTGPRGLTIVFEGGAGPLTTREAAIRGHVEAAYTNALAVVAVEGVTVAISTDPSEIIPGWGVGGFTRSASNVDIGIDPGLADSTLAQRLPSIVAHELHHIARVRGPGYGHTLLEAIVSEGLADHFALERFGQPPPPWTMALSADEYSHWLARARLEFDSTGFDHAAWFFGNGQIPNWTGYTLGFRIVGDYQAAHGGASAAALVNAPAEAFRPD